MLVHSRLFSCALLSLLAASLFGGLEGPLHAQEDAAAKDVRASDEQFVTAFNAGKAADVAALFSPQGELLDETGTLTQGTKELTELFAKFFEKFPGAKLAVDMKTEEQGAMVGRVRSGGADKFTFLLHGMPPGDPGLVFQRSQLN